MLDNTRLTWEQIKQVYPDQWVYMADAESVTGNLISAVVVFASDTSWGITEFALANRPNLPNGMTTHYTGQPIDDVEYNDDVELSLEVM